MQKFVVLVMVAAIVFGVTFSGCAAPAPSPAPAPAPAPSPAPSPAPAPAPAPGVEYPDEVVVGMGQAATGPLAGIGQQMIAAAQIAVEQINDQGGIKNLGGAKVNLIVADTGGNPDLAASETERLITLEKAVAVFVEWPTAMSGSEIAERYKTPHLHTMGVSDTTKRGYKYIFHTCNTGDYDAKECWIPMTQFADEKGVPYPESCYILYNQDDAMVALATGLKPLLQESGIEIVGEEIVPPTPSSYVPQLIKIETAAPDVLYLCLYTPDMIIFTKEVEERQTYFPYGISSCGAGAEDPSFLGQVPMSAVEKQLFIQEDCDGRPDLEPWYDTLQTKMQSMIGQDWYGHGAAAYIGMWVLKDALERTEYSTDLATWRNNLRDALAETDITKDNCATTMAVLPDGTEYCAALIQAKSERIKFDENGQNIYSHGQISQIINGEKVIMWPFNQRQPGQPDLVFPIPPWDER